jgi:hypothetical protein
VHGKLELEAWEKTVRIVKEGRKFFILKVVGLRRNGGGAFSDCLSR